VAALMVTERQGTAEGGTGTGSLPELLAGRLEGHVLDWRISAVGHRPVDHMGRDLLLASLFRDP
jgi:hypothetical protein